MAIQEMSSHYDLIIIGAGASGLIAAIHAGRRGKRVALLEKLPTIATKLKATGGGRCNLTNTLSNEAFIEAFGREGRFMMPALEVMDSSTLQAFFQEIGVETHAPDGFRIFPLTHNASTIITALHNTIQQLPITLFTHTPALKLLSDEARVYGVITATQRLESEAVIIASGGMGYPSLGSEGDGYQLAQAVGHTILPPHPAMMPLQTKEQWVANCRADTIPKVTLTVDLKKYKKLKATGDLIFTKTGIRGPVVLDFSREITPLLAKFEEVPLRMNLTKGMNEEQIRQHLKQHLLETPHQSTLSLLQTLLPQALSQALCTLANASAKLSFGKLSGESRNRLIQLLASTPLTITGHDGFKMAMVTRGGVSLKEIDPKSLESKKVKGLYFCGEVVNLDGPCGGYNLQWAFASGYLAGGYQGTIAE